MDREGDRQRLGPFAEAVLGGTGGRATGVLGVSSVPGLYFQSLLGSFGESCSEICAQRKQQLLSEGFSLTIKILVILALEGGQECLLMGVNLTWQLQFLPVFPLIKWSR